jgi:hypothetical protein
LLSQDNLGSLDRVVRIVSRLWIGHLENHDSIPGRGRKFICFWMKNVLLWEVLTEEENVSLTQLFIPALQIQLTPLTLSSVSATPRLYILWYILIPHKACVFLPCLVQYT